MQESETLENADRHETGGIESSPLLSPVFLRALGVLRVTYPKASGRKESSIGMVQWIPACTDKRKRKNARMTQTQKSALLHRFYLSRYRHFLESVSIRVLLWFSPFPGFPPRLSARCSLPSPQLSAPHAHTPHRSADRPAAARACVRRSAAVPHNSTTTES